MYCEKCGNKLEDNYVCCPVCGHFVSEDVKKDINKTVPVVKETNIMSILAIIFCWIPIAGWIFGGIGLAKSKKIYNSGKTLAIVAIVISTFIFILNIIFYDDIVEAYREIYTDQQNINQAVRLLFNLLKINVM